MKIGLLLPRSVIYSSMAFDIVDGLKACFKKTGENNHEIISASIGVAGKNQDIYARCEQLLLDGADIIVGYMNPLSAEFIHPLFESSGKLLLVLDTGYHFPSFEGNLSNAYFISLQGNLCCRAIIRKAIENGKQDFAFTCSLYDAGYRPSYTYAAAIEESGATLGYNHVTPLHRADFTLKPLAEYLENNKNTALLASFCGDMAEDFFKEAKKLNLIASHKTYVSGFTAEEEWLSKIPYPGHNFDCAVAWSVAIDTPENEEFVQIMENIKPNKSNLFSLLGWEAALFITASEGKSFEGITIDSPRGRVYMNPENRFTDAPIFYATVVKNAQTGNCLLADITKIENLDEERNRIKNDIAFIQNTTANSWLNAYACLDS